MMSGNRALITMALAAGSAFSAPGVQNVRAEEREPPTGLGMALSAGGGVEDFTDAGMRASTGLGGMWDVRWQVGTRLPVAVEAAYAGSVQSIDALGLDGDALLMGNALEAGLRLNATTDEMVQPYLFAAAAWRHYQLLRVESNTSDVADTDDVFEVPFGAGVGYRLSGVIADIRIGVRLASGQSLVPTSDGEFQAMHRWGGSARIGYEF